MLTNETIYGLLGITESYQAPHIWTVETKTALLGQYTSEERAIKSLAGICEAYRMFGDKSKVIDMLQDDEVEV